METAIEKSENNEMTQSISNLNETGEMGKDSIEERYNKLRGLAVKLKKKVADLTDQLQNSEIEKQKINSEKDDLQNRILRISDNAKKLQAMQSDYDKLQDETEQMKSENKQIMKNLQTLVTENGTLKENFSQEKENVLSLTTKLENSEKEKKVLTSSNKQLTEEIKKLKDELKAELVIREQKDKEYEEMKNNLEIEKNAHLALKNKNNSVLSLEVQNYEKSIDEMKNKISEEQSTKQELEKNIDDHLETIILLNKQINELRENCLSKTNQMTNLEEKNESTKSDLNEVKLDLKAANRKIEEISEKFENEKMEKEDLQEKFDSLLNEKNELLKELNQQKENFEIEVKNLNIEISRLNELSSQNKQEIEAIQEKFNSYKLRAQSVLRVQQSSKNLGIRGKSAIEMEEELEHSQSQNANLREKCENYRQKLESFTNELTEVKEERDHALAIRKELSQKILNLRQELMSAIEQNKIQESKILKLEAEHKKEQEIVETQYRTKIETLKKSHWEEMNVLKSEMERTKNYIPEKHESSNYSTGKIDHQEMNNFTKIPAPLIEREECEGSESVDSTSQAEMNEEKYHKQPSLIPLDELLNSPDDLEDYHSRKIPRQISRQEFEACGLRIKHLTALLADAERDIAKLVQQNEILKEDIRRQQRSEEREKHANNFEYLKNVVFKFVTLKNGDERSHLIPVLTTILKLSPDETQKLNSVAGVAGKSWIPVLPIPGWNNL